MKNFLLIFAVFSLSFNSLNAQDQIYWTEVALEVTPGKAPLVYKLVDDFYSSIEFPEIQGENGSYSEQMWSFYVEDPGTFAQAFVELNNGFSNGNYISLGQYTGGERNESHYIYTTHNDAKSQFTFFPDNEEEQNAFAKFQSIISPISQYRGSTISTVLGTWN